MRPVKPDDWVLVPADENPVVATVVTVEPGALVVVPQTGEPARRVPLWQATTPNGQKLAQPLRHRRGQLA